MSGLQRSTIDVLPPRSVDDEAARILDGLDRLQTLLTLQMRHGEVWVAAVDLVQRTRILIVERCKPATDSIRIREADSGAS